mmetsp:Transcript_64819/g.186272  ORF Transcript_64819/g.186272 Transcript_64819/m.186272 type:complete len:234 (-) Transcript_64819:124-825(-)
MADADLIAATRKAITEHEDGLDVGPVALLKVLQETNSEFSGVGIQKFKKVLTKVKAAIKEEQELARIEALKPKTGSTENCPGRHGLKRFMTNHTSYCCDTCRCYLPEGAPMWGCRQCDWDVCEGRCHPCCMTLSDFRANFMGLESQVEMIHAEGTTDMKTRLAQVETEAHKLEKQIDNATIQDLVKFSAVQITEDQARNEKKNLLNKSEGLLSKIETIFHDLRAGDAKTPIAE